MAYKLGLDAKIFHGAAGQKASTEMSNVTDVTQKRAGAVKPQGTFYAKAASALRGNMMEQGKENQMNMDI